MRDSNQQTVNLTKRQLAVIDELAAAEMSEAEVLKKFNVGWGVYRKWCRSEQFCEELRRREEGYKRQSELLLAKYAPLAAAKLVALTESEKDETVRKACLDIIAAVGDQGKDGPAGKAKGAPAEQAGGNSTRPISPEKASRLLEVLAEKEKPKAIPEQASGI